MSKIITIANEKGGVGKSTIAWNLAIELSKKAKVQVIDLDKGRTFNTGLSLRDEKLKEKDNMIILPIRTIKELQKWYDIDYKEDNNNIITIIDTGGYDSDINVNALAISDFIIVPTNSDVRELYNLQQYASILTDIASVTNRKIEINIVFSRINPQTSKKSLEKFHKPIKQIVENDQISCNFFDTPIRYLKAYDDSFQVGQSISEYKWFSMSIDFKDFVKEVIEKLK